MKNYSTIETPSYYILEKGIVHFQGSLLIKKQNISPVFLINNQSVKAELLNVKTPKSNQREVKWAFHHVIDEAVWNKRGVVELEIRDRGDLIGRHCWRIEKSLLTTKPPLTAFLHMPKCAGTSIRIQLDKFHDILPGQAFYPESNDCEDQKRLSLEILSDSNCIYGHFKFGFHEFLNRPVRYITVLRDPFEFIESQYFFAKYFQKIPDIRSCSSIKEALEKIPIIFDNTFTRWIGNVNNLVEVKEDDYLQACKNISNHFDIIGFTHSMDETNRLLGRYLGLPFTNNIANQTEYSLEKQKFDKMKNRAAIEKSIQWDLKLFKFAKKHKYSFS